MYIPKTVVVLSLVTSILLLYILLSQIPINASYQIYLEYASTFAKLHKLCISKNIKLCIMYLIFNNDTSRYILMFLSHHYVHLNHSLGNLFRLK